VSAPPTGSGAGWSANRCGTDTLAVAWAKRSLAGHGKYPAQEALKTRTADLRAINGPKSRWAHARTERIRERSGTRKHLQYVEVPLTPWSQAGYGKSTVAPSRELAGYYDAKAFALRPLASANR